MTRNIYRPQTHVCLSTEGLPSHNAMGQADTPPPPPIGRPLSVGGPSPPGQQVGGSHPTGMHPCNLNCPLDRIPPSISVCFHIKIIYCS